MKFIKKPYCYAIVFTAVILLFSSYVLIDTFLISKTIKKVVDQELIIDDALIEEKNPVEFIDTDDTYQDDNITINIEKYSEYKSDVYIADIVLKNVSYLKTGLAKDIYGRNITETTTSQADRHQALLAINGDFYGFRNHGIVLRNGTIYRTNSNDDDGALVVYNDGSFASIVEVENDINILKNNGAWQIFSFGPDIINNYQISVLENGPVNKFTIKNPRTAIGIIDKLHYIFVVVDGRSKNSEGVTLYELANIMMKYNCRLAYNLDGGGSSTIYFNGKVINNPSTNGKIAERKVSDIVYIGY